jgi:type VI protein secretion system component Hcp
VAENLSDVYLNFRGDGLNLAGECTDDNHPGSDGWIQIRSFGFGFGFEGGGGSSSSSSSLSKGKDKEEQMARELEKLKKDAADRNKKKGNDDKSWGKSGALTFEKGKFSKNSDLMSASLIELCHSGTCIPKVTLAVCRYGGAEGDVEMAFFIATFENVLLSSCNLNLAVEGVPSEDYEFQYEAVRIQSRWTSNDTGERNAARPVDTGWDLTNNDYSAIKPDDYCATKDDSF